MSRPELDLTRQRYAYACGYCGVTEDSAGGLLTVDHHRPLSAGGDDHLDNLVYACVRCNQYKHSYWPTATEAANGLRILHPMQDLLTLHYRLNRQTGRLEPLTEAGRFHVSLLRLNRPQLVKYRLAQELHEVLAGKLDLIERQIQELQETIAAQDRYIAALREQLD